MEAEARYTWVGAAVLALVAALVTGVVWLKNVGGKGDFNQYAIHFEEQPLDGLEVGAAVNLRGIKVGRVDDYALAGDKLNRVRVLVRIDRRAPAYTNTVAVVTRNFVTGIAAITLVNDDPPGDLLTKVPAGETYPVIGEGRSGLQEIAGQVNRVGEMASVALTNVNEMLSAENRTAVMATIRNLRDLSAGITERLGTLDTTRQRVGSASTQIGNAVAKIGNTASTFSAAATQLGQAGERVAAVADRGVQRLDTTLGETDLTLAEAKRAFSQLAVTSNAVQKQASETARRLEDTAASVDDQLGATMAELRLSINTATRVLDRLREPRAALLGPDKSQLGPGEKLP